MSQRKLTRRDLLKGGAAALALPYFIRSGVLAQGGQPGANDRVDIGIIGLGGRARQMAATCALTPEVRIVAVSDVLEPRIGAFIKDMGEGKGWYSFPACADTTTMSDAFRSPSMSRQVRTGSRRAVPGPSS